ncbi:uncharacterized protein BCR38DRAFT_408759 [Pseudomassariella vexata]|uniref:RING-type E3 ubiquitin transferase n=1 Tax=Pseudomassariella vexata TaxID=1141098 RepID=A0A1Y2E0Y9_9PEZI|nr:uncharacterized protein BCR38DRAFT_408759 [Pseudomassariella vexata]ORY65014.1 hypothetical protein BCR38DRAFT_408759 [Pseudomassariella vexata]
MESNSSDRGGRHLDASADREVVYCHQCEHEWYRDQGGLICPNCDGEATEIVTPENDPRNMEDDFALPGFDHHHRHLHDTDSDPEEDDIEEHLAHGPGGFFGRRTLFRAPGDPEAVYRSRAHPENSDDIIRRFTEMLGDIGGPNLGPPAVTGRSGPATLFSGPGGQGGPGLGEPRVSYTTFHGPGFTGNVSSYTITSSSGGQSRTIRGGNRLGGAEDPFQSIFGNIFGHVGPPPGARNDPTSPDAPGGPGAPQEGRVDLAAALNQLFASVLNPTAVHGDAVYSQEALDRIITNLMEANPQSNAPPPASPETIAKLPRKKLDEQMLGPELKGECTICIDEMHVEDEVIVLPCKHWFHEACVTLWLKEHNTCPICRTAIDGSVASESGATPSSARPQVSSSSSSRVNMSSDRSERLRSNLQQRGEARLNSIRDMASPYDRGGSSRGNSNSPPLNSAFAQSSRDRSPSPATRRSTQSDQTRESSGSGSGGPLHWLRDQFSRGERRRS